MLTQRLFLASSRELQEDRKESEVFISFTYFKDAPISSGSANQQDLMSLWAFQKRLDQLGHFDTRYQTIDGLKLHFNGQLDKLAAGGFIAFAPDQGAASAPGNTAYEATLNGSGAIAQGPGATAVGERAAYAGGTNTGGINTGTRIDTGGSLSIGGDFVGRDRISKKGE